MLLGTNTTASFKHEKLSPFLRQYGTEGYAYATLQAGMEYFITDYGYLAFVSLPRNLVCWRKHVLVLSNPICAPTDWARIVIDFQKEYPKVTYAIISELFARTLRDIGYSVTWSGYEPILPVQSYPSKGDWKDYDLVRRAQNEAKRHKLTILEVVGNLDQEAFKALNTRWLQTKHSTGKDAWLYARTPVYTDEPDVRKFVAKTPEGELVGYAFYDPVYEAGQVVGYAANIIRTDENRFSKLVPAIHMAALDKFKSEGKKTLNLLIVPFKGRENSAFNDCKHTAWIGDLILKYGNQLYNFAGKARHKDKYRGSIKPMYAATNGFSVIRDATMSLRIANLI